MEQRSQASLLACIQLACCYFKSFCNKPCLCSRKQKDLQKRKCVSMSRQAQKESMGGGRQTFLVKAIYKMEGGNTKYLSCLLGLSMGIAKPFPKWASQSISKMLMCAHWNLKRDGKKGKEKKKRGHTGSTLDFFFLSFSLFSRKARAVVQSEDSCSDNGAWEN